ncbi:MAG: hypothetical protein KGO02_13590 [Alphaproteobacteria bacterium]|nr:hypothetical protein [Alphaproteobacteria bacterium]
MPIGFSFGTLVVLLVDFALSAHVMRSGRSYLWILPIVLFPPLGWIAYVVYVVLTGAVSSDRARRFADDIVNTVDPGRAYREKKRDVERVGSVDSKRALAEECIRRGLFQDAVELYESAMAGPLGAQDTALLSGLARAKLLAGDGAGAEAAFDMLKQADPAAFNADAELDYARSLALQGKTEAALAQYEKILPKYPGEEARCRYGMLLKTLGQEDRARRVFREIVESVKGAPSYYRRRQREWVTIARRNLAG